MTQRGVEFFRTSTLDGFDSRKKNHDKKPPDTASLITFTYLNNKTSSQNVSFIIKTIVHDYRKIVTSSTHPRLSFSDGLVVSYKKA